MKFTQLIEWFYASENKGSDSKSPLSRGGGTFFPSAAQSFHRNDPQIFLRGLEDVWKDYNAVRRSILTLKTFYSLEKFKKSWKTAVLTTFLVPTNFLWSEYQITKTTILSRFPPKKCFHACYWSQNVFKVFFRSRRTCYIPITRYDMPYNCY